MTLKWGMENVSAKGKSRIIEKEKVEETGIPRIIMARGNVPSQEEFNSLVSAFNRVVKQLKVKGLVE